MKKTVWLLLVELLLLAVILVFRSHDYRTQSGAMNARRFEEVEFEIEEVSEEAESFPVHAEAGELPEIQEKQNLETTNSEHSATGGGNSTVQNNSIEPPSAAQPSSVPVTPVPVTTSTPAATALPETDSGSESMDIDDNDIIEVPIPVISDSSSDSYEGEQFEIP